MCRPSYTPFARERHDSKRIEPCHQDPQGLWYRRHVERTDKLETRADKLRRMTQVDAMPCTRHAEHADVGVQTLQAIEFGITEDGPLREVPRHNDGRTAQPARKLVRVEPVPRPRWSIWAAHSGLEATIGSGAGGRGRGRARGAPRGCSRLHSPR